MKPFLLTLVLAAATATAAIDTNLLNLVMPDATILTGINVDQSVTSPFGQYVLAQIQLNDAGFLQFVTATGFDPRRDLHEILAATPSTASATAHAALILGRGTFQPAMIVSTATAQGAIVTPYRGFNLISPPENNSGELGSTSMAFTFIDGTTAAMGDTASVKAAIDRHIANATYSGPLAQKAVQASASNAAWFATVTPLSDFLSGTAGANMNGIAQTPLLQAVQQASGGVQFGSTGVTVSGDALTRSPQDAQSLGDVLKFLVSMIQSNTSPGAAQVASIANSAQFTVNGSTLHLSLTLPEPQIEQLFMPQAKRPGHLRVKPSGSSARQ